MKKTRTIYLLAFILLILVLVIIIPKNNLGFIIKNSDIRKPVFAGSWYSSDKDELTSVVDGYLNNIEKLDFNGKIKAIIVPHAGYFYSGQIAATSFKQLEEYETVFLIGPSHKYYLKDLSILNVDYYQTPLGNVKVSEKAEKLLKEDIVNNIKEAHENEHSLEVELAFLQRQLKDFEIVPILVGETDSEKLKDLLAENIEEEDLIVVSVDLSHYHKYEEALALDSYSVSKILDLDDVGIFNAEIDAPWAVSSLLKLAKQKQWKPYFLAYSNSGDITGDKESVVGYSAIVFVETFSDSEKSFLTNLAWESVETYLKTGKVLEINEKKVPEKLKETTGCFVTLNKNHELRGCIGHILPKVPLYKCVIENSINAAVNDIRFNPVNYPELKNIDISISVLTVPKILEHENSDDLLKKLKAFEQGVVLKNNVYQSTYLPSVWEQIPDKQLFLSNLCVKGQMPEDCWKDDLTEVYVYESIEF